jgi:hypothetical protein
VNDVSPPVHEPALRLSKTRRERLERGAILAAAVGLHVLVLFLLARPATPAFPDRSGDEGAIDVTLDRARRPTRPAARSEATSVVPHRPARSAPQTVETLPVETLPVEPAPSAPLAAPAAAAPGPRIDLATALRAGGFGCENRREASLSPEERARCQEKLGALALKAPPLSAPMDPVKRAYYDAVAEAYKNRGQPIPLNARGGNGMFDVNDSVFPGHGPRVGCSVKFGPNADKAPKGPPRALRAGPCFIQPPNGSLSPEADIRKPY